MLGGKIIYGVHSRGEGERSEGGMSRLTDSTVFFFKYEGCTPKAEVNIGYQRVFIKKSKKKKKIGWVGPIDRRPYNNSTNL